ncbi:MAG: hypothetical protein LBP87_12110 [Planctomycetaceae bacterium]|nr:hypothetical protein [Planctomycetaceae bacterium]
MKHTFLLLILIATVAFITTGCANKEPKIVPVTGIITQNGKPLTDIRLEFSKVDTGAMSFAEPNAEGKFTLTSTYGRTGKIGAEPGKYIVSVYKKGKLIPLPAGVKPEDVPEERRNARTPETFLTMSDNKPIEVEIANSGENNIVIDLK